MFFFKFKKRYLTIQVPALWMVRLIALLLLIFLPTFIDGEVANGVVLGVIANIVIIYYDEDKEELPGID